MENRKKKKNEIRGVAMIAIFQIVMLMAQGIHLFTIWNEMVETIGEKIGFNKNVNALKFINSITGGLRWRIT